MGSSWRDDARFAWRRLWKRPLGAAASVLTLACAIGAGSATWSLLSSLLLHPLPVEAPERLFAVIARMPMPDGGVRASGHFLYLDYQAIRDSEAFAGLAAGGTIELLVGAGAAAVPQRRTAALVSYDYFDTLGIRMQAGRTFTRDEDHRVSSVPGSRRPQGRWFLRRAGAAGGAARPGQRRIDRRSRAGGVDVARD